MKFTTGFKNFLADLIYGSVCPKCSDRGVRKTGETQMGGNFSSGSEYQVQVSCKCSKCGHTFTDYRSHTASD